MKVNEYDHNKRWHADLLPRLRPGTVDPEVHMNDKDLEALITRDDLTDEDLNALLTLDDPSNEPDEDRFDHIQPGEPVTSTNK